MFLKKVSSQVGAMVIPSLAPCCSRPTGACFCIQLLATESKSLAKEYTAMEQWISTHSHGVVDLNTHPWSSGSQHTAMEQWISTHSHGAVDLNTQPWSSGSQHTAMEQWISTHSHGAVDLNTHPWSSGSQHTAIEQWIYLLFYFWSTMNKFMIPKIVGLILD